MTLLWVLLGCKRVEPAPEALDDLFHFVWAHYDDEGDEALVDAVHKLDLAVDGGDLEPPDGTVSDLTDAEIALVGVTDRSAAAASGVFIVNRFPCSPGQLERILSHDAQDELYEGVYESYARDFDSPASGWLSGSAARLSYDISYRADPPVGSAYDANSRGDLRRVDVDAVIQRSVLPEPAVFDGDGNSYLDQDYQLEVYIPVGGEIVHVYAMWRDANFSGFSMADESFQRIVINNMLDWDDQTAKLCDEGRP
jgi:hypothetical protein